jgi:adenine-specific DNA methylase
MSFLQRMQESKEKIESKSDKKKDKEVEEKKTSKKSSKKEEAPQVLPRKLKEHSEYLLKFLSEEELRETNRRKSVHIYPTLHQMIKLAGSKLETDVISYVNEAILQRLEDDGIIEIHEMIHGKLKK